MPCPINPADCGKKLALPLTMPLIRLYFLERLETCSTRLNKPPAFSFRLSMIPTFRDHALQRFRSYWITV
jgi:hypothetical protein